ncbi:aspartate dehydrogenase [Granulosicoccus sp. 3-233]|uniref:aspartate dehydrogenase n=1 Tax=Granulosicoccus sp. 3-233 TaxID=3417969 RepID=UPI003D32F4C7
MSDILLIGYGAIGQYVASALEQYAHSRVSHVLCRQGRQGAVAQAMGSRIPCIYDPAELPDNIDLVVECAGHSAVSQYFPALLEAGKDILSVSGGALADADLEQRLTRSALVGDSRLTLLSGAIGSLDALSAASVGGLESVTYRGRKPPQGWRGSAAEQQLDLDSLQMPVKFFEGTARQAALSFPKNANVAAAVAMAGIGFDGTRVELIADPSMNANRHEVEAVGEFGQLNFSIEGKPLPGNPRSSALTAMSVVRQIHRRNSPLSTA